MDNRNTKPDSQKDQQPKAKGSFVEEDDKPVFRSVRPGGTDDGSQVQFRSMTAAPIGLHRANSPFASSMGKSAPLLPQTKSAPTASSFADKTNYSKATPKSLPPSPFRLEMHTHFHVRGQIQQICSVIGRKLAELGTDFQFKQDKCKWKVDYAVNAGNRVHLNLVLYKSSENNFIVEVQRRSGDVVSFMGLYREIALFCNRNQLVGEQSASKLHAGATKKVPNSPPGVKLENYDNVINPINEMLLSKFADVQMQGILAIISLSTNEPSRQAAAVLMPHLVKLSGSIDLNTKTCAAVAISRLCDDEECRKAFMGSEGWQFILENAAGPIGEKPELQRECLRVVELLCPLYHIELSQAKGAERVLELINGCDNIVDLRIKKHACGVRDALRSAGVLA